ncbi:MAG: hypothetical protein K8963_08170 [Proteobacteria bacterium]|nr:hypothetical protein [Pseudomonadota bacterium]
MAALLLPLGVARSEAPEVAPESSSVAAEQTSPYYYYLDGRQHRVWLCADKVASFPNIPAALSRSEYERRISSEQTQRAAAARFVDLTPEPVSGGVVRLYTVSTNMGRSSGSESAGTVRAYADSPARQASDERYHYSEVFSTTPGGKDFRALPGGVFVKFDPDWDRSRIDAWLADQEVGSYLAEQVLNNNVFMIHTPQGMEALDLANRLQETGEVLYAEPNWWRPVAR